MCRSRRGRPRHATTRRWRACSPSTWGPAWPSSTSSSRARATPPSIPRAEWFLGHDDWHTSPTWPPPGARELRLYLGAAERAACGARGRRARCPRRRSGRRRRPLGARPRRPGALDRSQPVRVPARVAGRARGRAARRRAHLHERARRRAARPRRAGRRRMAHRRRRAARRCTSSPSSATSIPTARPTCSCAASGS